MLRATALSRIEMARARYSGVCLFSGLVIREIHVQPIKGWVSFYCVYYNHSIKEDIKAKQKAVQNKK